ncbi:N-acetylglucosamine kinase [Fusibacter bizertensis]
MYYIGIDGGGTNTIGLIGDHTGVMAQKVVGPSNYHNIGISEMKATIEKLLMQLLDCVDIGIEAVEAICFGGAGIDTSIDVVRVSRIFNEIGYRGKLSVINDALVAMAAENGSLSGGILISGTGSVAYGFDAQHQLQRVGGWGHIVDDVGSAYAIAVAGLKAVLECYDGRGEATTLFNALKGTMQIEHEEEIIDYLYNRQNGKDQIAKLAKVISDEASKDAVAARIICNAAEELLLSIKALDEKCGCDSLDIVLSGSVLINNDQIYALLKRGVPNHIKLKRLKALPVQGAYVLATQL